MGVTEFPWSQIYIRKRKSDAESVTNNFVERNKGIKEQRYQLFVQ